MVRAIDATYAECGVLNGILPLEGIINGLSPGSPIPPRLRIRNILSGLKEKFGNICLTATRLLSIPAI
jgi:hypothetical protein